MKTAVICWSDTHQNHIFGLCPPNMELTEREGTWVLNPVQRELWWAWNSCWEWVDGITLGCDLRVGVSVGDAIENDSKIRSQSELVSLHQNDALEMAVKTLEPITKKLDHFFIVKGTEAHVGKGAWTENQLAKELGAIPDKKNKSAAWMHLISEFSGVKFDIAHHPSGNSNVKRNYPAVATRLAYDVWESYCMFWKERPPDVAVRGHLHRFADSGTTIPTRGIILPGFQYKTYYLSRIGKDADLPDVGMVVFICEDGKVELNVKRVIPQNKRAVWSPKNIAQVTVK